MEIILVAMDVKISFSEIRLWKNMKIFFFFFLENKKQAIKLGKRGKKIQKRVGEIEQNGKNEEDKRWEKKIDRF